ncbi:hypothetical protein ACFVVQ_03795 [Paenibacillus chitinolyticus]|uniref:hypothetical protein n=1 Tax=Paenibacillus chitinolyticus TaxID=79263 RepID=UPI0036D7604D
MNSYDYVVNGIKFFVQSDYDCNALDLIRPDNSSVLSQVYITVLHDERYYNDLLRTKEENELKEVTATTEFSYLEGYTMSEARKCRILFSHAGYKNHPHIIMVFNDNEYKIIAPKITDISDRYALRIIREYTLRNAENRGGILLHAASATIQGNGVLICGNSGDGKTTTLCSLLLNANANYISNDRTILQIKNNELTATSFPLAMNLGVGTFQALQHELNLQYNKLKRKPDLKDSYEDIFRKDWNSKSTIESNWIRRDKIQLTTSEVEEAFRCKSGISAPVKIIIFPKLSSSNEKIKFYPISYSEIRDLIDKNIYTPVDPDFKNEWLGIRKTDEFSLKNNVNETVKHLQNLKLYRLECGIDYLKESKGFWNNFIKNIDDRKEFIHENI